VFEMCIVRLGRDIQSVHASDLVREEAWGNLTFQHKANYQRAIRRQPIKYSSIAQGRLKLGHGALI